MKWYVRHLWKTNHTISLCCMQPIMKRAPENNCKSYMQTKGPKKAFDRWWKDTQSLHLILLVYSGINFHIIDISSLVLSSGLVCYLYTTSLLPVCRIREENMFYIPVMPYLCFFTGDQGQKDCFQRTTKCWYSLGIETRRKILVWLPWERFYYSQA